MSTIDDQQASDYLDLMHAAYQMGRAEAHAERDQEWNRIAQPVARGWSSHAELEERRWGAGGREKFGDPRPTDFPGRGVEALSREAEPDVEAGL